MAEPGRRPHVTVVGDLILDRYLIGDATKLNPEQPGVVIRVDKEEDRLGGAAAVAMIAASLGSRVTLAGAVGRDLAGARLRQLIDSHNIEPHLWIDDRPTTWKQRIVVRGQLRPDRCDREDTTTITEDAAAFIAEVPLGDVLLIADYAKGVGTKRCLDLLADRAHDAHVPILVDPARGRDWWDYECVFAIKANLAEATVQAGMSGLSPHAMASKLSRRHRCHVIITLGAAGLVCGDLDGETWHLPAAPADVRDVCGAGDTVLASLGVSLTRGMALRDACQFAVERAGQQVARLGCST